MLIGLIVLPVNLMYVITIKMSSFIFIEAAMLAAIIIQGVLIKDLLQFKIKEMPIDRLFHNFLSYKKLSLFNHKYGSILGISVLIIFVILEPMHFSRLSITAMIIILCLGLLCSIPKLKWHNQKMKEIEQSLAELREFENEKE